MGMSFIEITIKVIKKVLCFPFLLICAVMLYIFYLPILIFSVFIINIGAEDISDFWDNLNKCGFPIGTDNG